MKPTLKNITLIAIFSLLNITLLAQNLYVDISTTNKYPGAKERFTMIWTLKMSNGMFSSSGGFKVKKPDFKNFNVIEESEGQPQMSIFSGNFDPGALYKYQVELQATKEGSLTIDPVTFVVNGKEIKSASVTLQIGAGDPNAEIIKRTENLFTSIEVSNKTPYTGEQVIVTYKIYSRYRSINYGNFQFPTTQNLWTESIDPGKNGWKVEQQNINGFLYNVYTIKKDIVFAQTSGEIEIPAFTNDIQTIQGFYGNVDSFKSNKVVLNVKPLPIGAPESFTGQVGKNYSMNVDFSTTELKANEPIDLKISIDGKGNLKQLIPLPIDFPKDFEIYDPETKENIKITNSGLNGSKTFNYLVIPRHRGEYTIPEIKFSYFDLETKKYKTISHPSTIIKVEKGAPRSETILSNTNQENVELLNTEIHHIKLNTNLTNKDDFFFGSGKFYTLVTFPFLLFIGALIYKVKKPKEIDQALIARKKASKSALKRLSTAQSLLENKDDKAYFEELYKALYGYLSDKFKIPASEMDKTRIQSELSVSNVGQHTITNLIDVIDNCEMARFAPVSQSDAEKLLSISKECIQTIEKHVK